MTHIKELQSTIEKELLFYIINNMKQSDLTMKEAESLASEYYALQPFTDEDDLIKKLKLLALRYRQAWNVFKKIGIPYIEERKKNMLGHINQAITIGDIDSALKLTKEAILYG